MLQSHDASACSLFRIPRTVVCMLVRTREKAMENAQEVHHKPNVEDQDRENSSLWGNEGIVGPLFMAMSFAVGVCAARTVFFALTGQTPITTTALLPSST